MMVFRQKTYIQTKRKQIQVLIGIWASVTLLVVGCNPSSAGLTPPVDETIAATTPDANLDAGTSGSQVTGDDFIPTDWSDATHSKDADPNFDEVFDDTQVKRLDIVITASRWDRMIENMTEMFGEPGTDNGGPPGGGGGGGPPPGGGGGGPPSGGAEDENPIFVPAEVFFQGIQWYRVGVRYKGNSSLGTSWRRGIMKLSFKLDFDEYEDDFPQIDNQRFHGFKKLSLKNNFDDRSFLREKVAAEIFANGGLASSHTAFYQVYVDHGEGPVYFGLYTLVEEVDDTVIETQFSSDDGNLYKPDGRGATFAQGGFEEEEFDKKTNEDDEDWSDIQALFSALHDPSRTSNPAAWRTELEAVFDTEVFLKYLAINTVIQNWDTYGKMTHNYYLYNCPDTNKLTWIPWDNNEALDRGKMGGALNLDFSNLNGDWPLIDYLYADEVYRAQYDVYVQETIDGVFKPETIEAVYNTYAPLVDAYATSEAAPYSFLNNNNEFHNAIADLLEHVNQRATAVANYLD